MLVDIRPASPLRAGGRWWEDPYAPWEHGLGCKFCWRLVGALRYTQECQECQSQGVINGERR